VNSVAAPKFVPSFSKDGRKMPHKDLDLPDEVMCLLQRIGVFWVHDFIPPCELHCIEVR
jgi:hypothetical protein